MKEVFSVLDLVTKYNIPKLLEDIRKVLSSFPLTDTIILEEEANQMLLNCAKYLRTAILQNLADNSERQDGAVVLLVLRKDLKMTPPPTTYDEDEEHKDNDEEEMVVESKEDKRHQAPKGCKLFVRIVTQETSNHNLQAVFEVYGTVTDAYNPGKGLAFVTFTKPAEANAAMETALDNEKVKDKIPKDDHRAAAGNATADDAMTKTPTNSDKSQQSPLARRKVAQSATWSRRTE